MVVGGDLSMLEREHEYERLLAAVADARGGDGRLVVLRGDAGIGKTRLLASVRDAADASVLALSARGTPLEQNYPFGIVRQLLEAQVVSTAERPGPDLLSGAAGLAAPVFYRTAPPMHDCSGETRRRPRCMGCAGSARTSPRSGLCW